MSVTRPSGAPHRTPLPYVLAVAFTAVSVCLYLFAVSPCADALARAKNERTDLEERLRRAGIDIRSAERINQRLDELNTLLAPYRAALLTPVLESYAMAAKSVLDPLAEDANLTGVTYTEDPVRALPLSKPQPKQLHARKPIRMTCTGTYMEIVSFILRVEQELPLVALQAWTIIGSTTNPDRQEGVLIFEWPVKGGTLK